MSSRSGRLASSSRASMRATFPNHRGRLAAVVVSVKAPQAAMSIGLVIYARGGAQAHQFNRSRHVIHPCAGKAATERVALSDCQPAPGGPKVGRSIGGIDEQDGGRTHRTIAPTGRGFRAPDRTRPLCQRSAVSSGDVTRRGPAHAARPCRDPGDRCGSGIGDAGGGLRRDRR